MKKSTSNKYSLFLVLTLTLTGLFFIMSSCGGGGGGSSSHAPAISGLSYNPSFATQNQGGGQVAVSIYFNFTDQGGDVSSITVTVYDAQGVQVFSETDSLEGAGITSGYFSGTLYADTSIIGKWTFEIYLADSAGSKSNKLTGTFTVISLVSITVTPSNPSIANGTTQQFTATGSFSDNSTKDLTAQVIWSSSDTNKATIDSSGLARGVGVGSTTITAVYESISGFTTLTVTPATIIFISISPGESSIYPGAMKQFSAAGTFTDMSVQDITTAAIWNSSNIGVATISNEPGSTGLATTLTVGVTMISATLGNITGYAQLNVEVPSIAITPTDDIMPKGVTRQFTATGTFSDYTTQDMTALVTWSSSDTGVAIISNTISSKGEVTSIASGTTTITAISGNKSSSTILTVTNWTLQNLGTTEVLNDVTWSGTQFVVVGCSSYVQNSTTAILISSDGKTWIRPVVTTIGCLQSVVWSGTQFVAVGMGGTVITSSDGVTWTQRTSGTIDDLSDVAWSGTQFITVGGGVRTSPDGVTWIARDSGTTEPLIGVTWSGTQFIAVGGGGTIVTSPNGVSWTQQSSGVNYWLASVVCSETQCVAGGGSILTSPDGEQWTERVPAYMPIESVIWSGTQFMAVGSYIYTSPNGVVWTLQTVDKYQRSASGVAWSGTQFVVVGGNEILTSP